jgi:hypothetical protein
VDRRPLIIEMKFEHLRPCKSSFSFLLFGVNLRFLKKTGSDHLEFGRSDHLEFGREIRIVKLKIVSTLVQESNSGSPKQFVFGEAH